MIWLAIALAQIVGMALATMFVGYLDGRYAPKEPKTPLSIVLLFALIWPLLFLVMGTTIAGDHLYKTGRA